MPSPSTAIRPVDASLRTADPARRLLFCDTATKAALETSRTKIFTPSPRILPRLAAVAYDPPLTFLSHALPPTSPDSPTFRRRRDDDSFAFVEFENERDAEDAYHRLHDKPINGLAVNITVRRRRRPTVPTRARSL